MPTAFAMVLNEPVAKIIDQIGHDGSENLFPHLPDPQCRKGFHLQELIGICLGKGYKVTPIEANPLIIADEEHICQLYSDLYNKYRLHHYVMGQKGVCTGELNGNLHACAWDGKQLYDPTGFIYPVEKMTIDTFYLINY